jgi:CRP-like cAMP-binding protein
MPFVEGFPFRMTPTEAAPGPLVRKLERVAHLPEAERAALEGLASQVEAVPAHSELVHEGDKPRGVLLVLEGMAYRYRMRANGARQILAYLVPGDMGDLDAGLFDRVDHGIATFSACKVVWIEPDTLSDLRRSHPAIDRALRVGALVDASILRAWLVNVGGRMAIERLSHLFCELLLRLQAVGLATGNGYVLPVSQGDLADSTGLSDVHLNRSLQELRRRSLIHLKARTLTIPDVPALMALAEFRPDYLNLGGRVTGYEGIPR